MNDGMFNFGFPEVMWFCVVQAAEKYPYFPGQEATLRGDVDFLLEVSTLLLYLWEYLTICRHPGILGGFRFL
jgi:hypothetical protein